MESYLTVASSKINVYFTCSLCTGYFRQPYTIRECIHTFCKSCIFKYIVTQDKRACPVCDGPFGTYPLSGTKRKPPEIVQDHVMEGLVKKLFPQLDVQDTQEETKFYAKHAIPIKSGVVLAPTKRDTKFKRLKGAELKVVMRPVLDSLRVGGDEAPRRKHFTYGWQLTERYRIFDLRMCLKKQLAKRGVDLEPHELQIHCNGKLLGTEHTLNFIQKTVWRKESPIQLEYRREAATYPALDV
ncbi:hypothetical protein ACHHYP_03836 [Achlya hypogyna]|uniref:RING-type domain-containing protein n=1 Tax=Achlya hypogyna TaxID=1202772 RepID=A0A1V9Z2S4_ACHHY|nr:hypothetical protein ACHHYP_03836 [Achlya hypogyna]